jgi:hypothetical protein
MIRLSLFFPLARPLLAAVSITQAVNNAAGIILLVGAVIMVAGILVAAVLGMLGRDAGHIKMALICAAIGGLAEALVVGFFAAGGVVLNLSPTQPD